MSRYRSNRLPAASGHAVGIEEAVNDFLLHHQRKGDSESYLRELRSYLIGGSGYYGKRRAWLPFMPWVREAQLAHIGDLTRERVGAYLDHVREDASKGDYGKVCAILKRLFGFFITEQWLEREPLRIERSKRLKAEIKVFTPDEVERMRQVIAKENARDWAIFMLLLDTGIRASELCNLRLDDVRWDRQELIIRPQIAKNRSFRVVPLFGSVKALRKYRAMRGDTARCDRLFLAFYHTPVVSKDGIRRNIEKIVFSDSGLTRNGLFFLVKKWGQLARISESRCSPHTFRHFFATQYLRNGGNILSLQKILGHSRLDITERYLSYGQADVKAEHERFSPASLLEQRKKPGG
jgi:site-specific recombinase XerD